MPWAHLDGGRQPHRTEHNSTKELLGAGTWDNVSSGLSVAIAGAVPRWPRRVTFRPAVRTAPLRPDRAVVVDGGDPGASGLASSIPMACSRHRSGGDRHHRLGLLKRAHSPLDEGGLIMYGGFLLTSWWMLRWGGGGWGVSVAKLPERIERMNTLESQGVKGDQQTGRWRYRSIVAESGCWIRRRAKCCCSSSMSHDFWGGARRSQRTHAHHQLRFRHL